MQPGKAGHPYKAGTARCKSCNGIGVAPCPLCGGTEVALRAPDPDYGPNKTEEEDEVSLLEWLAQFNWGQLLLQLHLSLQNMTYQVMRLRTTRFVSMWLDLIHTCFCVELYCLVNGLQCSEKLNECNPNLTLDANSNFLQVTWSQLIALRLPKVYTQDHTPSLLFCFNGPLSVCRGPLPWRCLKRELEGAKEMGPESLLNASKEVSFSVKKMARWMDLCN